MDTTRKRGRLDAANGNGTGAKRSKETDSFLPGLGSKTKPCTKFFSTSGCPFGEGCHFLHYVPGGLQAVSQIINLGNPAVASHGRNAVAPPAFHDGASGSAVKTRMCNKYNTAEGCKFGERCRYAHGEWELGKPALTSTDDPMVPPMGVRPGNRFEMAPPSVDAAAGFGVSATAKISVDASLAGAIIGKGGVNTKQICRMTGAKLSILDHESDSNLKNIELEGTFDQIKQASAMVRELIVNIRATASLHSRNAASAAPAGPGSHFKTKLCDNFSKGSCTFGDRCHFAHGESELRKTAA